ncbi:MAG: nitrous oxide-stimulated promoter family protein [Chloroflexi bacterium]|nr:nitrous oxide-stimulated promoter family protein [Chloroflexota bacterium]
MCHNALVVGKTHARITRERRTVAAMIDLYCRNHHGDNTLCSECAGLLVYASERLEKCPFQEGKTVCSRCPVHCFQPAMRERIRAVMRFSGPRMLRRHPIMAVRHFIDRARKEPVRPREEGTRTGPK